MPRHAPRTALATHVVANQPPEFAPRNLYQSDPVLRAAALREGGEWLDPPLAALGEEAGSEAFLELRGGRQPLPAGTADLRPLRPAHRRGGFHPAYHALMAARDAPPHPLGRLDERAAGGARRCTRRCSPYSAKPKPGDCCPDDDDLAAVAGASPRARAGGRWLPGLLDGHYDPALAAGCGQGAASRSAWR